MESSFFLQHPKAAYSPPRASLPWARKRKMPKLENTTYRPPLLDLYQAIRAQGGQTPRGGGRRTGKGAVRENRQAGIDYIADWITANI
jgi:hypothetical protein